MESGSAITEPNTEYIFSQLAVNIFVYITDMLVARQRTKGQPIPREEWIIHSPLAVMSYGHSKVICLSIFIGANIYEFTICLVNTTNNSEQAAWNNREG